MSDKDSGVPHRTLQKLFEHLQLSVVTACMPGIVQSDNQVGLAADWVAILWCNQVQGFGTWDKTAYEVDGVANVRMPGSFHCQ